MQPSWVFETDMVDDHGYGDTDSLQSLQQQQQQYEYEVLVHSHVRRYL